MDISTFPKNWQDVTIVHIRFVNGNMSKSLNTRPNSIHAHVTTLISKAEIR